MFGEFSDNHILTQAAERCKNLKGLSAEVGVFDGRGSDIILHSFGESKKTHILIDPYGSIPYDSNDDQTDQPCGNYTNSVRDRAIIRLLAQYGYRHNIIFFNMEDSEFFSRFHDGVPVYNDQIKTVEYFYSFAYLDGPHSWEKVKVEAIFFSQRMVEGGCIVFDNIDWYDHFGKVEEVLLSNGLTKLRESKSKISYIKH